MRLRSKCDATLANLEREAAEVEGLKQGLDRRHRQAEKEASELASRERDFHRYEKITTASVIGLVNCVSCSLQSFRMFAVIYVA